MHFSKVDLQNFLEKIFIGIPFGSMYASYEACVHARAVRLRVHDHPMFGSHSEELVHQSITTSISLISLATWIKGLFRGRKQPALKECVGSRRLW
jgi:hypothetical protein